MTDEEYKKRKKFFLRFLKENGVYSRYMRYIKSPSTYNGFQKNIPNWTFDKCAKKHGMSSMVTMLISWSKTEEGYDFWENIHNIYLEKYTNFFNKNQRQ